MTASVGTPAMSNGPNWWNVPAVDGTAAWDGRVVPIASPVCHGRCWNRCVLRAWLCPGSCCEIEPWSHPGLSRKRRIGLIEAKLLFRWCERGNSHGLSLSCGYCAGYYVKLYKILWLLTLQKSSSVAKCSWGRAPVIGGFWFIGYIGDSLPAGLERSEQSVCRCRALSGCRSGSAGTPSSAAAGTGPTAGGGCSASSSYWKGSSKKALGRASLQPRVRLPRRYVLVWNSSPEIPPSHLQLSRMVCLLQGRNWLLKAGSDSNPSLLLQSSEDLNLQKPPRR